MPHPLDDRSFVMAPRKRIALIAHDNRKGDLLEWAVHNRDTLARHELSATGTTGALLARELGLPITRYRSGPLGGDQQIGAAIVEGTLDFVVFFTDPLAPHPHDVDVKALLRIAVVYNVPIACNRATADFLLTSALMDVPYVRLVDLPEPSELGRGQEPPVEAHAAWAPPIGEATFGGPAVGGPTW